MQETPKASRLHIAILGRRNAGKSSLINALTNQKVALVSDVPGTTTDPVYKAMEILPIGPVMIIDTAGIDDSGCLGTLRVERTMSVLNKADLVIIVLEAESGITQYEKALIEGIKVKKIPIVGVINKTDKITIAAELVMKWSKEFSIPLLPTSVKNNQGIEELKKLIITYAPPGWQGPPVIGDLIQAKDTIILVTPIDSAAPKGRLILPQVQTIRDILDHDGVTIVVKETELKQAIENLRKLPRLIVTDSQAFERVSAETPPGVMLTSFSILFARHKGDLETLVSGVKNIEKLKSGDTVLIAEACTHHQQADDIGTVKIPRWLQEKVGGELKFEWAAGSHFPEDLSKYSLIIHCGACMLNRKEMLHRLSEVSTKAVPVVNYGILIAYINGILEQALEPFPHIQRILSELN
ncbi:MULTISPECIES: [FeFe] hydrogenase H-cluster maturation GTPase HydF [Pelosinus]|uniref:(FeFe)-hydrogenase H-cluster maturation GTPase HydF n=1 Tax=Pelosinus fermentans B4 TaxID=1149862 RepID=I9LAX3_9FIRM|nr:MULTISPECIES: [FeFe] hydrogenase H-cluster maturation GTPase HydF [Pelosinus]EIW17574.1 (FeFe)-hydrogenase H-cluster maturation GTPase HydF [Pelosinus fermentans B4]EIW23311.1 small GTP-binding protein [Pelosinus fermentans A11]OAM92129.1 (FeFe)-hydrogenase H-cluster maturation GTPase HydF [Pelosinus fermentans DSM 17108]SDQ34309.1 [FeFe] hydrogenase H-cluster maturation GTPase HydF [Pelosinus fermentans]